MGMFDEIICKAPIDGGLPSWIDRHTFQTKDLDCTLTTYTIEEDGRFSQPDFSGTLEFYTSNIVGSGPGIYTEHGEDAEGIECEVIFLHSKLVEPIKVKREFGPAWPASRQHSYIASRSVHERTHEEQSQRYDEHLVGKRVYVLWGGQDVGYWAKVVQESKRHLCLEHEANSKYHEAGDLELIDRRERDHIFWDTEEEALATHRGRQSAWDAESKAFQQHKLEWEARR